MIKHITSAFIFCIFCSVTAQDFSALWQGHFSYNNINDIAQGDNKIFAASDNVIFTYDLATNQIETLTTIDGLSGQTITTISYSEIYNMLLINMNPFNSPSLFKKKTRIPSKSLSNNGNLC